MIFNLINDGRKYYLCMKGVYNRASVCFFSLQKSHPLFSENIKTDKKHSIIEKELVELIWTLKEGEDYSYDEVITPLLRAAKLKNIGI
jgi:hypothetical protein